MEQEEQMWKSNEEEPLQCKGMWAQLQEARLKGEVKEYNARMFSLDELTELMQKSWEQSQKHREETKEHWPDISLWPEDLPEGVYQGSIAGVRGMYSTKFRDLLKEAAKREYEKNTTQEELNRAKEESTEEKEEDS